MFLLFLILSSCRYILPFFVIICLYALVYMNITHSTQFTCLKGCITLLSLQVFFSLALQPPLGVVRVFYSPLVGFSLLAYEVS